MNRLRKMMRIGEVPSATGVRAKNYALAGILIAAGVAMFPSVSHGQASRTAVTATRAPNSLKIPRGTVAGYVFWDARRVAYSPSAACQGLQVGLSAINSTGIQSLGTTSQFQLLQPSQPGSSLYECSYTFQRVPEGEALMVQLNISAALAKQLAAKGPFPLGGTATLVKVPGGQCTSSPNGNPISSTYLESGWVGCGENTYNVNFELVVANPLGTVRPQNSQSSMLLPQATGTNTAPKMLLQPNPQPGGPVQSNGMLVPAVRPTTGAQPSSSTAGGFTGGVRRSGIAQPVAGSGSNLNAENAGAPSALIGLLRKQGSLKVVSGQRTHYALHPTPMQISRVHQPQGSGPVPSERTMAAPTGTSSRALTRPVIVTGIKIPYTPSELLSAKENVECQKQEAKGAAPAIFRVDGKTTGMKYSPDPQTNPHTIVGCGFGNTTGAVHLEYGGASEFWGIEYTVQFTIQSWSDHEIVASVESSTSGVPDWSCDGSYNSCYVTLVATTKLPSYFSGGQFIATKQTIPLTSILQKESSLDQSGSPHFLSPVSNYYGLTGTAAVTREGLSGPVGGQDQFTLPLAPGFAIDSTQTDLLVSDTNSNVTSQPATANGNTITITYPVVSLQSGNSTAYYSIYGLTIWVTGPVGMNPIAQ